MCFTGESPNYREEIVNLALKKRVRNKRKRAPDMCLEVLLTSTVRRLRCEIENERYFTARPAKRLKMSHENKADIEEKVPDVLDKSMEIENEIERAVESLTLLQESPCHVTSKSDSLPSEPCTDNVVPETIQTMCIENPSSASLLSEHAKPSSDNTQSCELANTLNYEDMDFDTLLQNLLDICEPLGNVEDLMKEYSMDPTLTQSSLDILGHNDPFLPGMFEVMCS
ncbi:predicted protein [Nematostella vectensis]|uniref:SERTA domain-containing protein n=1 Tax=Nematostella vectensis TaxID=45351 RepID=A7RWU4_NEMVE|nr:predicted protein [Nematostella vectensis]|eukprot:XP_001636148.1 predicted protein [Nematostella vectensis]